MKMKKVLVLSGAVSVAGLLIVTLFIIKGAVEEKAKDNVLKGYPGTTSSIFRIGDPCRTREPSSNIIAVTFPPPSATTGTSLLATIVPNWDKGLISESELDSARLAYKSAQAQYIGAGHQYHNSTVTSPIGGWLPQGR